MKPQIEAPGNRQSPEQRPPIRRRSKIAIIALGTAVLGLVIAGIVLPHHFLSHTKPPLTSVPPTASSNPEAFTAHNTPSANPTAAVPTATPKSASSPRPKISVEQWFAQETGVNLMIIAHRTANGVTMQIKNIDTKHTLSLKKGIDSLTLHYGQMDKSVPIEQFTMADGSAVPPTKTSQPVQVSLPVSVKELVSVRYEHADKKNRFSTSVNAMPEGAKTSTRSKQ